MKHQARGYKSLAFFFWGPNLHTKWDAGQTGDQIGEVGPNACQLGTEVCVNAGVGNIAVYKIDDKLCRNSELDRRSVLSVPKTVQSKLNRDEILYIFIIYGEQRAIPS